MKWKLRDTHAQTWENFDAKKILECTTGWSQPETKDVMKGEEEEGEGVCMQAEQRKKKSKGR